MKHILHLCSVRQGADELAAVVHPRRGLALVRDLIPGFTGDVRDILAEDLLEKLESLTDTTDDGAFRDPDSVTYGAPYRHPRMIWGIGLNYVGPRIVPLAEAVGAGTLADVQVSTVVNGEVRRINTVSHMRYSPEYLISFHSKVMPLYPGDIISTGTPGAIHVQPGDTAECRVSGVGTLSNPVTSVN